MSVALDWLGVYGGGKPVSVDETHLFIQSRPRGEELPRPLFHGARHVHLFVLLTLFFSQRQNQVLPSLWPSGYRRPTLSTTPVASPLLWSSLLKGERPCGSDAHQHRQTPARFEAQVDVAYWS